MKGNEVIDCPACAGPTALGGGCATCNGATEINQEVYETFMADQAIKNGLYSLQALISDALQSATNTDELKQTISNLIN